MLQGANFWGQNNWSTWHSLSFFHLFFNFPAVVFLYVMTDSLSIRLQTPATSQTWHVIMSLACLHTFLWLCHQWQSLYRHDRFWNFKWKVRLWKDLVCRESPWIVALEPAVLQLDWNQVLCSSKGNYGCRQSADMPLSVLTPNVYLLIILLSEEVLAVSD